MKMPERGLEEARVVFLWSIGLQGHQGTYKGEMKWRQPRPCGGGGEETISSRLSSLEVSPRAEEEDSSGRFWARKMGETRLSLLGSGSQLGLYSQAWKDLNTLEITVRAPHLAGGRGRPGMICFTEAGKTTACGGHWVWVSLSGHCHHCTRLPAILPGQRPPDSLFLVPLPAVAAGLTPSNGAHKAPL